MALKIHHLNCGTLCPHGAPFINGHGKITDDGKMVCHCLLIESNDGLVLVDTGFGIEDVKHPNQRLGYAFVAGSRPVADYRETAYMQVKELGFSPNDVRHILVTHLDLDHAGGLADFPQAKVHIFAPEFNAAMNPNWREKQRYKPHQWAHGVNWQTYKTEGEKWQGFDSIRAIPELKDEILLVSEKIYFLVLSLLCKSFKTLLKLIISLSNFLFFSVKIFSVIYGITYLL